MKLCTKCKSEGPFFIDNATKDGLSVWCKTCKTAAKEAWRKLHPELVKEQSRRTKENQKKHPDFKKRQAKSLRKYRLKKRYRLTPEEWEIKFQNQGRCCDICKTTEPGPKGWSTDHDHELEQTRSILCTFCNPALGLFKDSPELLRRAARYIEYWKH